MKAHKRIENMLYEYPKIDEEISKLLKNIRIKKTERDNEIESYPKYNLDQVAVQTGKTADPVFSKVYRCMKKYDEYLTYCEEKIHELKEQKKSIDEALTILNYDEKVVIKYIYFDMNNFERTEKIHISRSKAFRDRKNALKKLNEYFKLEDAV